MSSSTSPRIPRTSPPSPSAAARSTTSSLGGRQKIRRLKAEFLSHGIDLTNVDDRLDTLTYLKKMQDQGMLPLGLEVCAMKQAEMEVLFMGNDGIAKWKKYYAERGIDIESAGDLDWCASTSRTCITWRDVYWVSTWRRCPTDCARFFHDENSARTCTK